MSISALTSEAARLLAYFQGAEASINSQVAAAVAAVPSNAKTYYVDAISGNDANAGTSGAKFATLNKALSLVHEKSGLYVVIYLQRGSTYLLNADCYAHNCVLYFIASGSQELPLPVIQLVEREETFLDGTEAKSVYGIGGFGLHVAFSEAHIKTATHSPELSGRLTGPHSSIIRPYGGRVRFALCEITINESPLLQLRGPGDAALFSNVTINTPGDGRLIWLSDSPISMFFGGVTLTGAKTLDDLVSTRRYSTSGYPLNFICNYDFGGA